MSKPNKIKNLLSYLFDITIERAESRWNPSLKLVLSRGRYRLDTPNASYSYEDLYASFNNAFNTLDIRPNQFKNVLVLGLGLGSIPFMLERNFSQNAQYTVVEIDEKIINLAKKYLPQEIVTKMNVLEQDAWEFINNLSKSPLKQDKRDEYYDLICFDIFLDNLTDSKFRDLAFLEQLRSQLASSGILLYNTLSYNKKLANESEDFFENGFKKIFPSGFQIDKGGNRMLVFIG